MKKYIGKFLGPLQIKEIKKSKENTYLGNPKANITFDNGSKVSLPVEMIEAGITEQISDWTELRENRLKPVVSKIITVLTDMEVKKSEITYLIGPKMLNSIYLAFAMANEKLWGKIYDDITMRDADKILKGEICTTKTTIPTEKKK